MNKVDCVKCVALIKLFLTNSFICRQLVFIRSYFVIDILLASLQDIFSGRININICMKLVLLFQPWYKLHLVRRKYHKHSKINKSKKLNWLILLRFLFLDNYNSLLFWCRDTYHKVWDTCGVSSFLSNTCVHTNKNNLWSKKQVS